LNGKTNNNNNKKAKKPKRVKQMLHHYKIEALPVLSMRLTRHDTLVELTSSGFNVAEAQLGMDFLIDRQDIIDKNRKKDIKPYGVG